MRRRPPRSTRTDTLVPYSTLFRSIASIRAVTLARSVKPGFPLRVIGGARELSSWPARKKGRGDAAALDRRIGRWRPGLEAHATHAAHAAHVRSAAVAVLLLLGRVGDHGLGRDQQARDRRGILQRRAHDLGRVDDAGLEHVHVLAVLRI